MMGRRQGHERWLFKINLLVFSALFVLVLGYFYWQIEQSRQAFSAHVKQHAQLVSEVVAANLRNASQSQQLVEQIVRTFLSNTARFVAYLEGVEPFSRYELAAYAAENGLCGIWIEHAGQPAVMAPAGWFSTTLVAVDSQPQLVHLQQKHQYVMIWPDSASQTTIALGFPAEAIEQLQQQMDVPNLLKTLSQLTGIAELRLEPTASPSAAVLAGLSRNEQRLAIGENTLILVVESDSLSNRVAALWREFFLFSVLLAVAAVLLSWLLYRYQNRHLAHLWQLQQELVMQREDALLGRAAGSISHEIRNPLNAISMGLQRLQLESTVLTAEHQQLLVAMGDAVQRTNSIVTGLQRYARPLLPHCRSVAVEEEIEKILALYRGQAEKQQIAVGTAIATLVAELDVELFGQLLENLVKNAVEAQPEGGFIHLLVRRDNERLLLRIENSMKAQRLDLGQCLEPYYTSKTRGTGLGLTMVRKIAAAHGGTLTIEQPAEDCFAVQVELPLRRTV